MGRTMKRGDMPASPTGDTTYPSGQVQIGDTGMTVREKMALRLMGNMLSGPLAESDCGLDGLAHDAVMGADALLAELERTGGE